MRNAFLLLLTSTLLLGCESKPSSSAPPIPNKPAQQAKLGVPMPNSQPADMKPMNLSEAEWKQKLTPEQYRILRQKGTERAFTGKYWDTKTPGQYKCAGCGAILFESGSKFDSGCGWPSFDKMIAAGVIKEHADNSLGMERTEVICANCGGHLGHVFNDGPTETGLRYCINSASIELDAKPENTPPEGPKK